MYYRKSDDTYVKPGYHNISGHRGVSLLANLKQFDNGSMSAYWQTSLNGKRRYWIYSYATPIAVFDPTDKTLYRIDRRYSVTTSQHQSKLWELQSITERNGGYVVDCEPAWGDVSSAYRCLGDALDRLAPV